LQVHFLEKEYAGLFSRVDFCYFLFMKKNGWSVPNNPIALPNQQIHLWRAPLECSEQELADFRKVLSPDEIKRADRYIFPKDQRKFAKARGVLRHILARYLRCHPTEVQFSYSERGKPSLMNLPLYFNVSHSHELALYGFSVERKIGVDLEFIREMSQPMDIAKRFFSKREHRLLSELPSSEQLRSFFACWTRKEAYVKAIGLGLAQALNAFEVSITPDEPAALLSIEDDPLAAKAWSLENILLPDGYLGCLAVQKLEGEAEGLPYPVSQYEFSVSS